MKRTIAIVTVVCLTSAFPALTKTAGAQWYVNPQMNGGTGGNVMQYGADSLLYGSAVAPGVNIVPGNGIISGGGTGPQNTTGTPAATESSDAGDGGGAVTGGQGSSFTSDPISAYTNAVYTGMANVIRSEGSYNRQTARGMIDYEKARALYVDNQLRIFSARRGIHRAKLAAQIEDQEFTQAAQARSNAFAAAHRPQPLDSRHLDSSSGNIRWPAALMTPEFEEARKAIDADFETRAKDGYDADANVEIKKHVQDLKNLLHEQVLKLPLENYSQARRFLDQLWVSVE